MGKAAVEPHPKRRRPKGGAQLVQQPAQTEPARTACAGALPGRSTAATTYCSASSSKVTVATIGR